MSPNRRFLFIGIILLSLFGTILTFIFHRDAPPVSALEIPQSTKDFFKNLSDLGHIKFDYVDSLDIGDFDNDNDYSGDFKKLEDENFIVYYRNKPEEASRAAKTLQYANQSIAPLTDFFGKYYYAKDVKNRKLPIYLALTESDFADISQELSGSTVEWAAGLTVNSFASNGDKLCNGIILNSTVRENEGSNLQTVVFHEMAHYNHFQCMNLLEKRDYMNWEVEGLASYFAKDWNKKIPSTAEMSQYSLLTDPDNYADSYWMGYHAFGLADKMGRLPQILQDSYSKSLIDAIPGHAGCSMSEYDDKWRNYCNQIIHLP